MTTITRLNQLCSDYAEFESHTLSLMASANYSPPEIRSLSSSSLTNITTEGFPGNRFHPGSDIADRVEEIAIEEACAAFSCSYANVQPHSASSANASVLLEFVQPNQTIMGLRLASGGHLTHGSSVSFSGRIFNSQPYDLTNQILDYDKIRAHARSVRPTMIICGASAYPRNICFESFSNIARDVGATLLADISHIAGLVIAGLHESPLGKAQIVTTSTYKQLAGPRGGIILSDSVDDAIRGEKLNRSVFPLTQGTPDISNIAAKAAALAWTRTNKFTQTMKTTLKLASQLADKLLESGFKLITGGTDTHMILLDLRPQKLSGAEAEKALEAVGILANKNLIPGDPTSPVVTSGLRLGTNILAARGFDLEGISRLSKILVDVLTHSDSGAAKSDCTALAGDVKELCGQYPIPDNLLKD